MKKVYTINYYSPLLRYVYRNGACLLTRTSTKPTGHSNFYKKKKRRLTKSFG